MIINPMTQQSALEIASWVYSGPYSFYAAAADEEDFQELVTPSLRRSVYFEALDDAGELIGFLCCEPGPNEMKLSHGLRPDLTGRGLGSVFLDGCIRFVQREFPLVRAIEISAAAANVRAHRVYQRAGFVETGRFRQQTRCGDHEFIKMRLEPLPRRDEDPQGQ